MSDSDYKNDFFGDIVKEKKAGKSPLLDRYSKQRFLPHVRIPVEFTVIIAISVLVLMIVSYAVGVEKGKRTALLKTEGDIVVFDEPDGGYEMKDALQDATDAPETLGEAFEARSTITQNIPYIEEEEEIFVALVSTSYIIQLASFKSEASAEAEVQELASMGVEADWAKKGDWYQVYSTGYRTIDEAKDAKENLLSNYEDCFIRKID